MVAVLSARVGSIGDNNIGGWISYRAAKAEVNQIIRTCAIELGLTHPELALIALHPGTVATKFSANYTARHPPKRLKMLRSIWPSDRGNDTAKQRSIF